MNLVLLRLLLELGFWFMTDGFRFCVVAPHAVTFDQQGLTKIGPTIEFVAALPPWMPHAQRQPHE
jgi:hypothetical protein